MIRNYDCNSEVDPSGEAVIYWSDNAPIEVSIDTAVIERYGKPIINLAGLTTMSQKITDLTDDQIPDIAVTDSRLRDRWARQDEGAAAERDVLTIDGNSVFSVGAASTAVRGIAYGLFKYAFDDEIEQLTARQMNPNTYPSRDLDIYMANKDNPMIGSRALYTVFPWLLRWYAGDYIAATRSSNEASKKLDIALERKHLAKASLTVTLMNNHLGDFVFGRNE